MHVETPVTAAVGRLSDRPRTTNYVWTDAAQFAVYRAWVGFPVFGVSETMTRAPAVNGASRMPVNRFGSSGFKSTVRVLPFSCTVNVMPAEDTMLVVVVEHMNENLNAFAQELSTRKFAASASRPPFGHLPLTSPATAKEAAVTKAAIAMKSLRICLSNALRRFGTNSSEAFVD